MSWFSITQHSKSLWDKHSLVKNICTGNIVGNFIFQKAIKDNHFNIKIRDSVGEVIASRIAPKFFPYSTEIANKFLEKSLQKDKLVHLGGRFRENLTTQNLLTASKIGFNLLKNTANNYLRSNPISPVGGLAITPQPANPALQINNINPQPPTDETQEIMDFLRKWEISQAAHKAMILKLRPECERAVKAGMTSATRAVGKTGYDFCIKKIISLAAMPLIYRGALTTLDWSGKLYINHLVGADISGIAASAQEILPINYLLWGLVTVNTLNMTYIFWNAIYSPKDIHRVDVDKEEIKKLAYIHAQASISKKLQENSILNLTEIAQDKAQIDNIVNMLINETIDLYWNDLKNQKFLGLPLVS